MSIQYSHQTGLLHHPVHVGQFIMRVTAPNPGPMTGNGTNTYIIGGVASGSNSTGRFAIVDPGPNIDAHIEAILESVGGASNIAMILVTHMHHDHSPAALPLSKLSGAPIYGCHPVDDEFQDTTCQPDIIVQHKQLIELDSLGIRCIYTPGHVDNHMCYLLENEQILMTGDHVMQGATVVIIPPHGNMKKYIESLQKLNDYTIDQLAPGHGEMITTPEQEINSIIQHRLSREQKVVAGLIQLTRANIEELTPVVYDDVDQGLHPIAQLSLLAHLIKLEEEGLAKKDNEQWCLIE